MGFTNEHFFLEVGFDSPPPKKKKKTRFLFYMIRLFKRLISSKISIDCSFFYFFPSFGKRTCLKKNKKKTFLQLKNNTNRRFGHKNKKVVFFFFFFCGGGGEFSLFWPTSKKNAQTLLSCFVLKVKKVHPGKSCIFPQNSFLQ